MLIRPIYGILFFSLSELLLRTITRLRIFQGLIYLNFFYYRRLLKDMYYRSFAILNRNRHINMSFAVLLLSWVLAGSLKCFVASQEDTLQLLQVMIRHGNRTATATFEAFMDWEIKTFQPFQFGQLTPKGRSQMFNVGKYLRRRYVDFLPDEFSYSEIFVKCAATNRVQESSAVAMAAVFPPKKKQTWQDSGLGTAYTPIPCSCVPSDQDTLLDPDSVDCPRYANLREEYYNSAYYIEKMNKITANGNVIKFIQNSLNLTSPMSPDDLYTVYENFLAMQDSGVPLTSWAHKVYPEPLTQMNALYFGYLYFTAESIRFSVGEFLKEILNIATLLENKRLFAPQAKKMFSYFGHDKTLLPLMVALGFETLPPITSFGAAMLMELHRNISTSEIGYKFVYRNETWADPITYVVPGCQEICPLSHVKKHVEIYIPTKPFYSYC